MASSSTSSIHKSFKYDVFLSFRGADTRTNFIDHLYHALEQKSIRTYKDDEKIKKGKRICDELIGSIEESKFYIIVFSKNYASSSWCLDELVKIMECHKMTSHTAYPVFYDVEPSEVRKQSGAVKEAFAKNEEQEAAGKWREAMKEAADLAGWELKNTVDGHEAKFIQKIVEEISLELRTINSSSDEKLVGMHDHIEEMARNIVRGAHPDKPYNHSRLWIDEEIDDILANNLGTEATRCIRLFRSKLNAERVMKGLNKMKELRFLEVFVSDRSKRNRFRGRKKGS
ncbi:hypothetical protein L1887_39103 [Cichorium endivia]|nr:hypothetical protein L1887_39103 [Cichorium endivia]